MPNETQQRLSKNERRAQAREQARRAREAEKKREKRRRLYLQGGVVLGVVAVLAIIGVVVAQTMKPAGPGPENMASGGVIFGEDLKVVTGDALEDPAAERVAPEVDRESLPLDVTIYVDYMCPACGAFEQQNGDMLEAYVGSGDVQLQIYPINFLDGQSLGTKYSTRAANMFSCVVEQQPDYAFELHNRLLSAEVQPAEGTEGLTDEQLLEQVEAVGGEVTDELQQCVRDRPFAAFIDANTEAAFTGVSGLASGAVLIDETNRNTGEIISMQEEGRPQQLRSTPTVIVNGEQWYGLRDGSLESYLLKVKAEIEQANGGSDSDSEESTDESTETEAPAETNAESD